MSTKPSPHKYTIALILVFAVLFVIVIWFRIPLWGKITHYYQLFTDREQIRNLIASFGAGAPFVFILIQILQVLFAPVPGEATGFIGGYLFGALPGFIYSTIGLTAGSWANFMIGRFLGKRYVRKRIPVHKFEKTDKLIKRQGVIVLFILFVIPGFPKDYLCLAIGLSTLPIKLFVLLSGIGRMPGTLALSLQGTLLYEQNYLPLAIVIAACILLAGLGYYYREKIYLWVEKLENK
jgi:uncharacterized membrane protein YdjX (TVP38/TMEM64 family)